jgi:hypothetical protein
MQRLLDWLTASRARVLAGAVLCAVLGQIVFAAIWLPGALVVLLSLRGSQPAADWEAALVAALTLGALLLSIDAGPLAAALAAAVLILPSLLIGRLLARGGSLSLAFQLSLLAALATLGIVHLALPDPASVWQPLVERATAQLERLVAAISSAGNDLHPSRDELRAAAAAVIGWGEAAWFVLISTMTAACLGLYAFGRQTGTARLGPEFRALKTGRTLAVVAVAMFVLAVAAHSAFATDVSVLLGGAFMLQGLALLHAAREMLGFGTGWLVATYVLVFVPIAALLVESALAAFGFLDNWLPLRARIGALAAKDKGRPG